MTTPTRNLIRTHVSMSASNITDYTPNSDPFYTFLTGDVELVMNTTEFFDDDTHTTTRTVLCTIPASTVPSLITGLALSQAMRISCLEAANRANIPFDR